MQQEKLEKQKRERHINVQPTTVQKEKVPENKKRERYIDVPTIEADYLARKE